MGSALAEARKQNFTLNFDDEFEWPNGAARDIWSPWSQDPKYFQSRTLKENPDYQMKSLAYVEREGGGGAPITFDKLPASEFRFAVAAREDFGELQPGQDSLTAAEYGKLPLDNPELDPNSLTDISSQINGPSFSWIPPDQGRWKVLIFYTTISTSQGQYVDALSDDAMRTFIRLVYDEYYKRFPSYFGSTIKFIVSDGEGTYGYAIAWTPKLFETFQRRHGYDLKKYLPLLVYQGGAQSEKVRCDYMDTITELFASNNAGLITEWCEKRGVGHVSSLWEDPLRAAEYQGSLMEVMRRSSFPETDGLFDRGRDPRDYIESASVAHFQGTRSAIEVSALLGGDSYLSPEKIRVDTNAFGAWGLNLFIPHGFDYDPERITFHPSWFYHQPWWRHFHFYADYVRRISYMNAEGKHVAPVVIFNPVESVWAGMAPVFDDRQQAQGDHWGNAVDTIDQDYAAIIRQLATHQISADAMDSYYLQCAGIEGSQLTLRNESFRVLILPPMTTIPLATMKKIEQFYDAGGTVFAMRFLPNGSVEHGKDDPEIQQAMRRIFGDGSLNAEYTVHSNDRGGKAFFVRDSVPLLIRLLQQNIPLDVKVTEGSSAHFYVLHRQKLGQDFYWIVNDSNEPRRIIVRFSATGVPSKWDALRSAQFPLFYRNTDAGTEVTLSFAPWDAYYVVFSPVSSSLQKAAVVHSDFSTLAVLSPQPEGLRLRAEGPITGHDYRVELRDSVHTYRGEFHLQGELPAKMPLNGPWNFHPDAPTVAALYARTRFDADGEGIRNGWANADFSPEHWDQQWLSPENFTVRQWYVMGLFPNVWDKGFDEPFPPEKERDIQAVYRLSAPQPGDTHPSWGAFAQVKREARWEPHDSLGYYIDLKGIFSGRYRYAFQGYDASGQVAYALTYVYSPTERPAQVRVTAKSVKVWINGQEVVSRYTNNFEYIQMREIWGLRENFTLHAGWNEVLVKSFGSFGAVDQFMFRIANRDGSVMNDLVVSRTKSLPSPEAAARQKQGWRWYRLEVPPGTVAMERLELPAGAKVFFNGQPLPTQGEHWPFPSPRASGNVVALAVPGDFYLTSPVSFQSGTTPFEPAVWARTGLRFYSGSATYQRTVTLAPSFFGAHRRILLDCGKVGVVAELWVNDKLVGTRVWEPYSFDLTEFARPGTNTLKLVVTNTMSNASDVGERYGLLQNIDVDGLVGPVEIRPQIEVDVDCRRF
jgi:hypothetical protein